MRRFLIQLQFNGKRYGGWQKNDNTTSVAGVVEQALYKLFGSEIKAEGCSRTDAGVSAEQYFFHFDADTKLPAERVCYKLDRFLPPDVQAQSSVEVDVAFHARKNVLAKTYEYRFYCGEHILPLINRDAYYAGRVLDEENMHSVCRVFEGRHDFSAFRTESSSRSSPEKTVMSVRLDRADGVYRLRLTADGFLYNMARIMAGAVVAAGQNKLTAQNIADALCDGIRPPSIVTLPPKALVLKRVYYDETAMRSSFDKTFVL